VNTVTPYIIAESAQGYEGSADIAKLLVQGAIFAKSNAVKFQIIYTSDLCEPGYEHFELFNQLEMGEDEWMSIRCLAKENNIDFIADVFGEKSLEIAKKIDVDGIKLHSTTFFDDDLVSSVLALDKKTYISIGGIKLEEIQDFIDQHQIRNRNDIVILFGFQAEPTPIHLNNLARIKNLKKKTGLEIGFMDHSEGGSSDEIFLSVLVLGMGVRIFEKHITLDREPKLEDYISGLEPSKFAEYVKTLNRLPSAIGKSDLNLIDEEHEYRKKALKKVVASRNIKSGEKLTQKNVHLSRADNSDGEYQLKTVLGKTTKQDLKKGQPVSMQILS